MGRGTRAGVAARIVALLRLIVDGGDLVTVEGVSRAAADLGVSPRTVYRDLRALEEAGVVLRPWQCPICLRAEA